MHLFVTKITFACFNKQRNRNKFRLLCFHFTEKVNERLSISLNPDILVPLHPQKNG